MTITSGSATCPYRKSNLWSIEINIKCKSEEDRKMSKGVSLVFSQKEMSSLKEYENSHSPDNPKYKLQKSRNHNFKSMQKNHNQSHLESTKYMLALETKNYSEETICSRNDINDIKISSHISSRRQQIEGYSGKLESGRKSQKRMLIYLLHILIRCRQAFSFLRIKRKVSHFYYQPAEEFTDCQ